MLNIQGLELNDYTFKKIFLSLVFCKSNFITTLYVLCCNEAKQKNHQSSEAITKVRERWYQRSNSLVPKSHFIMCLSLLENKVGLSPEDLAWLLQHLLSCWKSQNPPAGKMNQKLIFVALDSNSTMFENHSKCRIFHQFRTRQIDHFW